MTTIETSSRPAVSTFLLGMLVGASLVAGGMVIARTHNVAARQPVPVQSVEVVPQVSAVTISAASAPSSALSTAPAAAAAPAEVSLPRVVVIGHRLKVVVQARTPAELNVA